MRVFHFGHPDRPLFGAHHPPLAGRDRGEAVVLCYPFGPEYVWAHRAFRELAQRLAGNGFHVLRFDYYGTGDSSGQSEDGRIELWLEDLGWTIEEAKEASAGSRVAVVGLRLGGSLATLWGAGHAGVDRMVLWSPVLEGRAYLEELRGWHDAFMVNETVPKGYRPADPPEEALGTPLPAELRAAIGSLDLLALEEAPARRVLVVGSEADTSALPEFCSLLRAKDVLVDSRQAPGTRVWVEQAGLEQVLVPHSTLASIASWLAA